MSPFPDLIAGLPVIVLGELTVGFRHGTRGEANQSELDRFVANTAVEVLPVNEDVVGLYADIVLDLKKAGTPLPANDIWIAAVAARRGVTVPTYRTRARSPGEAASAPAAP